MQFEPSWPAVIGLVLLIEGVLPFLLPRVWRESMLRLTQMRDGQLRFIGMGALIVGILLICL